MTKGTYEVCNDKIIEVEDPYARNVQRDNSFRSCLCAMLVFIVLCLIISLIGVKWSKNESDGIKQSFKKEIELVENDHTQKSMGPFEKIEFTTSTVTKSTRNPDDNKATGKTVGNSEESVANTTINDVLTDISNISTITTKNFKTESNLSYSDIVSSTTHTNSIQETFLEYTNVGYFESTFSGDDTKMFTTESSTPNDIGLFNTNFDENRTEYGLLKFSTESTDLISNINTKNDLSTYTDLETTETTTDSVNLLEDNTILLKLSTKTKTNNGYSSTEGVSSVNSRSFERKSSEKVPNRTTPPPPPLPSQITELTMRSPKTDPSQIVITSKGRVSSNYQPVCNSPGCISAASRILILMNHSSTACEDFYEFACGGGMQAQSADSDNWEMLSRQLAGVKNTPSKYLKELNAFHQSCLRQDEYFDYEERMKRVRELAGLVGNFDLGADNVRVDFTDLFAKLVLLQSMPLFDVGINFDKKSNIYVSQLTIPRKSSLPSGGVEQWSALSENQIRCLGEQQYKIYEPDLNLESIYDSYVACKKNLGRYLNAIENSLRAFGAFSNLSTSEAEQRMKETRTTIEDVILKVLDELPEEREIIRTVTNNDYKIYKIADLQNTFKIVDWRKFFKYLVGHELSDDTPVQVFFPGHFVKLFASFTKTSIRNLYDAFMSIFLTDLFENFVVPQNTMDRHRYCLKLSTNFFHDIVSALYVNSITDKTTEENAKILNDVFTVLKENFVRSLQSSDWMDDSDKKHTIKKVNGLRLILNKKLDNENGLNAKYAEIDLNVGDFQKNFVTMLNFTRSNIFKLFGQNVVKDNLFEHFFLPFHDKPIAFYDKEFIVVPNGILEKIPKKVPGYITMARVGFHLAKAIGKHFDPTGIKHGLSLSEDFKDKYEAMVTKTNVFLSDQRTILINGRSVEFKAPIEFSTNQRIAENIAFKMISDLYANFGKQDLLPWISFTYSREKIFFLSVAQEMCNKRGILKETVEIYGSNTLPPFLLVENIMSNSKLFSDISGFDCPLGSGMNNNDEQKNQFPHIKIEDDYGENNEDIYRNK